MRISSNRYPVDRLFVLGAGASVAASAVSKKDGSTSVYQTPLDIEFPKRIANIALKRPSWVREAAALVASKFRPEGGFEKYPLEEGILRQLGLLQFFDAIHPKRSRDQIEPSEWLDLLSHLICVVLRRARENSYAAYSELVERRFPSTKDVGELHDRIISFNYDTLLDSVLLERREATDLYFDEIRSRRDRPSEQAQPAPLLLKLHGSINWRCHQNDLQTIIAGQQTEEGVHEIPAIWLDQTRAPSPNDDISPLIIPPLPSKPITSVKIFKWLWTRAYEYLYEAKQLVVIGYSLPNADQLATSMFGAFNPSRMERVVIVDPSTRALDRWRTVLKRTGLGRVRWSYFESLRDYIEVECRDAVP